MVEDACGTKLNILLHTISSIVFSLVFSVLASLQLTLLDMM